MVVFILAHGKEQKELPKTINFFLLNLRYYTCGSRNNKSKDITNMTYCDQYVIKIVLMVNLGESDISIIISYVSNYERSCISNITCQRIDSTLWPTKKKGCTIISSMFFSSYYRFIKLTCCTTRGLFFFKPLF